MSNLRFLGITLLAVLAGKCVNHGAYGDATTIGFIALLAIGDAVCETIKEARRAS